MSVQTITDIKRLVRPSTSVPFFVTEPGQTIHSGSDAVAALREAGKLTVTFTNSEDGLVQTQTLTFADLATYTAYDTALGIDLDNQFIAYCLANNYVWESQTNPFENTGISSPFTCTTVYTFPEGEATIEIFGTALAVEPKVQSVTVSGNTVTVVNQFANSADFTTNFFADNKFVPQLHSKGVTRAITYALVS